MSQLEFFSKLSSPEKTKRKIVKSGARNHYDRVMPAIVRKLKNFSPHRWKFLFYAVRKIESYSIRIAIFSEHTKKFSMNPSKQKFFTIRSILWWPKNTNQTSAIVCGLSMISFYGTYDEKIIYWIYNSVVNLVAINNFIVICVHRSRIHNNYFVGFFTYLSQVKNM